MTDSRSLPPAAALPDYLHALTESEGFTPDFDNLHELVADDPASVLNWTGAAGRVLTADYQQRVLAAAIAVMRAELPKPGYDMVQILILANNLAALLNKWQAVDNEMDQARIEFTRACSALSHQGVIVPDGVQWVDADLVCDLDERTHTVRIPAGTAGPWQRVRASAWTVQSLAHRCADRSPTGATTQVRGRDDAFDLIVAHPDGHLTIQPLPSDNDGRYLLTGISWSRPDDAENRTHDTEQRPDRPPSGATPDEPDSSRHG